MFFVEVLESAVWFERVKRIHYHVSVL